MSVRLKSYLLQLCRILIMTVNGFYKNVLNCKIAANCVKLWRWMSNVNVKRRYIFRRNYFDQSVFHCFDLPTTSVQSLKLSNWHLADSRLALPGFIKVQSLTVSVTRAVPPCSLQSCLGCGVEKRVVDINMPAFLLFHIVR